MADGDNGQLRVCWIYKGETKGYHIYLNGDQVHFTRDNYEKDMFIAELKGRLAITLNQSKGRKS